MVNVFVSSYNPVAAARALPDLLCHRMCQEAAEVLSGVHWNLLLPMQENTPSKQQLPQQAWMPPYRRSLGQRKHPVVLWAGKDRAHYIWLLKHMQALADEYRERYAKDYPKSYQSYAWLASHTHLVPTKYSGTRAASSLKFYGAFTYTEFLSASSDIRVQYRLSLLHKWLWLYNRKHTWRNGPPKWAYYRPYHELLRQLYGDPSNRLPKGKYYG